MFKCSKCQWSGETGKAWKVHSSRKHGGYSQKDWLAAAAAASGDAGATAIGHDSFVEAVKEAPQTEGQPEAQQQPTNPLADRFLAMKEKFADALAVLMWTPLEQKLKLEPLKNDDRKILSEGWKACLDCLDIQPQINPLSLRPRSRLLILLFPFLSTLMVLAGKIDLAKAWSDLNAPKPNNRDHRAEGQREDAPGDAASVQ